MVARVEGNKIMAKTLVAYFSASGTTKRVAEAIAREMGADAFEITPQECYTAADLNWNDSNSRSSREMNDPACRPALAGELPEAAAYDTVLVGFPIWWYVEPRCVDTFLDAVAPQLGHASVTPFATSGGSGIDRASQHLKELYPALDWKRGKLLQSVSSAAAWARELGASL